MRICTAKDGKETLVVLRWPLLWYNYFLHHHCRPCRPLLMGMPWQHSTTRSLTATDWCFLIIFLPVAANFAVAVPQAPLPMRQQPSPPPHPPPLHCAIPLRCLCCCWLIVAFPAILVLFKIIISLSHRCTCCCHHCSCLSQPLSMLFMLLLLTRAAEVAFTVTCHNAISKWK